MTALDEYAAMWRAMPWYMRLLHRVWWRAATVWAGLTGGLGPGERLILRAWAAEQEERKP